MSDDVPFFCFGRSGGLFAISFFPKKDVASIPNAKLVPKNGNSKA